MHRIYKYQLNGPVTTFQIPQGARFLSVQTQYELPTVWFLVDTLAPTELKTILSYMTGQEVPLPASLQFLGTIQLTHSGLVFHIFTPHVTPQA